MHRSFMVSVVGLAIFAAGCAVDTDEPEPTEKERPTFEPKRDRVEVSMPFETLEPATEGWDLAELIQLAETAVAERNLKAVVLPGIIRHSIAGAPMHCCMDACPSAQGEPRLPDPGSHAH